VLDNIAEAVIALTKRISGAWVAVVAMLFYPVLGLLLPVALNWSLTWLVVANLVGVYLAAIVSVGWLAAQVEAARRRELLEWTTELRHLSSEEFEWLVGETFRREGWKVTETGRQDAADGNVDLRLARDGERKLVQCKRWTSWEVPVDEIRNFVGTLSIAGLEPRDGIFVTLSDFTTEAESEARKGHLTLLDGTSLFAKMDRVRRKEACPVCGRPMRLDYSRRGWWFRCVQPGCTGKRDVGNDAGRAIAFLTEAR
jgi:restriction system protein